MDLVFIIVREEEQINTLTKAWQALDQMDVRGWQIPGICFAPGRRNPRPEQWIPHVYRSAADWIESAAEGDYRKLRGAVAFIELPFHSKQSSAGPRKIDPIKTHCGNWGAVAAMLVLSFPEIHWVFVTTASCDHPAVHTYRYGLPRAIARLRAARFCPLFDPTGLRNAIRSNIRENDSSLDITDRDQVAAAIDEEEDYAFYHAYVAYRNNYRTHLVLSAEMMRYVFSDGSNTKEDCFFDSDDMDIALVFEDVHLCFPDGDPDGCINDIVKRVDEFPRLGRRKDGMQPRRVFVTTGQSDTPVDIKNMKEIDRLQKSAGAKCIFKPVNSIYEHAEKANIDGWNRLRRLEQRRIEQRPRRLMGLRPRKSSSTRPHSAPGRLLAVAERLLNRATRLAADVDSPVTALHGATLAMEARELLAWRSPTLSLEALSLQHHLEVMVECRFYGVNHEFDVKERLRDIKRIVNDIGLCYSPKGRHRAASNAASDIVHRLVVTCRDHHQFDEELVCLKEARDLHRKAAYCAGKNFPRGIGNTLRYAWDLYVSCLLNPHFFLMATVVWMAVFSIALSVLRPDSLSRQDMVEFSFLNFVGAGIPELGLLFKGEPDFSTAFIIVSCIEVPLGILHFAVFLSYVFQVVIRR